MKKLLIIIAGLMMASCASLDFCQMYETKPIGDIKVQENALVFEDDNCRIAYNFWKEHGEIGFVFYNKTSENIYIHVDACFFVKNGYAYDYYQNRVFSTNNTVQTSSKHSYATESSFTNGTMTGNVNYYTTGSAVSGIGYGIGNKYKNGYVGYSSKTVTSITSDGVSFQEKRVITIPPKTSKMISEFDIKSDIFRSCDLRLHPKKRDKNSLEFTVDNTPLKFGNIISYSVGESKDMISVSNNFYISKITNYKKEQVVEWVDEVICGEKQYDKVKVFRETKPDRFYIWYKNNNKKY